HLRFDGQRSIFLTDKDFRTEYAHRLFGLAGLPEARTRWVDLYLNDEPKLQRLEIEPYSDATLKRFYGQESEGLGHIAPKSTGDLFEAGGKAMTGLPADGTLLLSTNFFRAGATPLERYQRAYPAKNHEHGHGAFQSMIEGMWSARGD